MLPVFFLIIGLFCAAHDVIVWGHPVSPAFLDWIIICSVGLHGITMFCKSIFNQNSDDYGWGNGPYKTILSCVYLAFGLLGILVYLFKGAYRIPVIFAPAIVYWATAWLQLKRASSTGGMDANAKGHCYTNIIVPLLMIGFWITCQIIYT